MSFETIVRGNDRRDASVKAADALVSEIERGLRELSGPLTVGWCGGTSPSELFSPFVSCFSKLPAADRERVQFVLADERRVPLENEQSNFFMLKTKLFDPLVEAELIRSMQVHPFPVELEAESAAKTYSELVLTALGGLHIVILGVGPDGHVAGIFPKHSSAARGGSAYYYVPDRPKPPTEGFSASRELLCACRAGFGLFFGQEKEQPLADYRSGTDAAEMPNRVLKHMDRAYIVTDLVA